jgi:hypothetical protein
VGSNPTLATTQIRRFLVALPQYVVVFGGLSW